MNRRLTEREIKDRIAERELLFLSTLSTYTPRPQYHLHTEPPAPARRGAGHYPHCADGPCDQGRQLCPSPGACRAISDECRKEVRGFWWLMAAAFVLGIAMSAAGVFL